MGTGKRLDHSQLIPRFRVEFLLNQLPAKMRTKAIMNSMELFDCGRGTLWEIRFYPYDKRPGDKFDWYPKTLTLMNLAKFFNCKIDDLLNHQKERLFPEAEELTTPNLFSKQNDQRVNA